MNRLELRMSLVAALMLVPAATRAETAGVGGNLVTMAEVRVPIVDGDRPQGTLHLQLVLQATDAAAAEHITRTMPRMRSIALGAAFEFARLYASPRMPIDAARLADSMTKALPGPAAGVQRVLLVEVGATPA
jgi:hypothetical protein